MVSKMKHSSDLDYVSESIEYELKNKKQKPWHDMKSHGSASPTSACRWKESFESLISKFTKQWPLCQHSPLWFVFCVSKNAVKFWWCCWSCMFLLIMLYLLRVCSPKLPKTLSRFPLVLPLHAHMSSCSFICLGFEIYLCESSASIANTMLANGI